MAIILCFVALCILQIRNSNEGFTDLRSSYQKLQGKLKADLQGYCELTGFVQGQMKQMYANESGGQADTLILQTYKNVYACADELASSRASCKSIGGQITPSLKISGDFVPCSTYMNTPAWNNDNESLAVALSAIPDDLANRIVVECQYYTQVLEKLQVGIDMAKNPPGAPPDSSSSPATDSNGNSWSVGPEGFAGSCSAATAQAKLEMKRKQDLLNDTSNSSCTIPSLDSEIARINALLDSSSLKSALSGIKALLALMLKIQADIEAIKKKWGDDGPKKSYTNFQGGDRTASLIFSMQQVK
jgi:hypothetical protein